MRLVKSSERVGGALVFCFVFLMEVFPCLILHLSLPFFLLFL